MLSPIDSMSERTVGRPAHHHCLETPLAAPCSPSKPRKFRTMPEQTEPSSDEFVEPVARENRFQGGVVFEGSLVDPPVNGAVDGLAEGGVSGLLADHQAEALQLQPVHDEMEVCRLLVASTSMVLVRHLGIHELELFHRRSSGIWPVC